MMAFHNMEKSLEDQSQTLQLFYYYFPSCKNPLSEAEPKMGKHHEYFCKKLSNKSLATFKTRYKHSQLMNSKTPIPSVVGTSKVPITCASFQVPEAEAMSSSQLAFCLCFGLFHFKYADHNVSISSNLFPS